MDNIHVRLHLQAVAAQPSVNFVAAMIRRKGGESVVPAPAAFRRVGKLSKGRCVPTQCFQRLLSFRRAAVHGGVIITVINRDQVMPVLCDELQRLLVAFLWRLIKKVVHFPFQEDLRNAVSFRADNGRPFPGPDQRVKEGVRPQYRLFIGLNAVNRRHCPWYMEAKHTGVTEGITDRSGMASWVRSMTS